MLKFARTQTEFKTQVDEFLVSSGFEANGEFRALVGSMIQHMDAATDEFDPDLLAKMIRKALINEWAFYLIKPERDPSNTEVADDTEETPSPLGS